MSCYLCECDTSEPIQGKVRDNPNVLVRRCADCGLVYLEKNIHEDDRYYEGNFYDDNLPEVTWEKLLALTKNDDERRFKLLEPLIPNKRYCDIGCGGGGILLLGKKISQEVIGVEPEMRWRNQLLETGIKVHKSVDDIEDESVDVVSIFHVVEHITNPIPFLKKVLSKIKQNGQLIIEVPNSNDALVSIYNCKAFSEFTYWSSHIFIYNSFTLEKLLIKCGVNRDAFTIKQVQRYPISNHLRWLAEGLPGGHIEWSHLDSDALNKAYAANLASMEACDTIMAFVNILNPKKIDEC